MEHFYPLKTRIGGEILISTIKLKSRGFRPLYETVILLGKGPDAHPIGLEGRRQIYRQRYRCPEDAIVGHNYAVGLVKSGKAGFGSKG